MSDASSSNASRLKQRRTALLALHSMFGAVDPFLVEAIFKRHKYDYESTVDELLTTAASIAPPSPVSAPPPQQPQSQRFDERPDERRRRRPRFDRPRGRRTMPAPQSDGGGWRSQPAAVNGERVGGARSASPKKSNRRTRTFHGHVKWYDATKNHFGFIVPEVPTVREADGEAALAVPAGEAPRQWRRNVPADVRFQLDGIANGNESVFQPGVRVAYSISGTGRRRRAVDVRVAESGGDGADDEVSRGSLPHLQRKPELFHAEENSAGLKGPPSAHEPHDPGEPKRVAGTGQSRGQDASEPPPHVAEGLQNNQETVPRTENEEIKFDAGSSPEKGSLPAEKKAPQSAADGAMDLPKLEMSGHSEAHPPGVEDESETQSPGTADDADSPKSTSSNDSSFDDVVSSAASTTEEHEYALLTLAEAFPHVDFDFLSELFRAFGGNFDGTFEALVAGFAVNDEGSGGTANRPSAPSSNSLSFQEIMDSQLAKRVAEDPNFVPRTLDRKKERRDAEVVWGDLQYAVDGVEYNQWRVDGRSRSAKLVAPDVTARMKLDLLSKMFPAATRKEIEDTFKFSRHSMTATQRALTERHGQPVVTAAMLKHAASASPSGDSDEAKSPHAIVTTGKSSGDGSPKKSSASKVPLDRRIVAIFEKQTVSDMEDFAKRQARIDERREDVSKHLKLKAALSGAAADAYFVHDVSRAVERTQQASDQNRLALKAQRDAMVKTFRLNNSHLDSKAVIDLHGLQVKEAIDVLTMLFAWLEKRFRSSHVRKLRIITGVGTHSSGNPRLFPEVKKYLNQQKIRFTLESKGEIRAQY